MKGRMSSHLLADTTPQELREMESQMHGCEEALAARSKQRTELEGRVAALKTELQSAEASEKRLRRELQLMAGQKRSLQERVTKLEGEAVRQRSDPAHLAKLTATVECSSQGELLYQCHSPSFTSTTTCCPPSFTSTTTCCPPSFTSTTTCCPHQSTCRHQRQQRW